ncbi:Unknown protein, partial [Striga hermonthica]
RLKVPSRASAGTRSSQQRQSPRHKSSRPSIVPSRTRWSFHERRLRQPHVRAQSHARSAQASTCCASEASSTTGCAQWHASMRGRPCPYPTMTSKALLCLSRAQPMPATAPEALTGPAGDRANYHPEKFSSQGDPRVVDEWVQGLEMIFEVVDCPDCYHVLCAQIQLTGDARLWWNAYYGMRPGENEGCTWDRFKELICEKYYPAYYRAEMERQFLALKQSTRTVDEYEREFTRLGAFIPDLVSTEAKRSR